MVLNLQKLPPKVRLAIDGGLTPGKYMRRQLDWVTFHMFWQTIVNGCDKDDAVDAVVNAIIGLSDTTFGAQFKRLLSPEDRWDYLLERYDNAKAYMDSKGIQTRDDLAKDAQARADYMEKLLPHLGLVEREATLMRFVIDITRKHGRLRIALPARWLEQNVKGLTRGMVPRSIEELCKRGCLKLVRKGRGGEINRRASQYSLPPVGTVIKPSDKRKPGRPRSKPRRTKGR